MIPTSYIESKVVSLLCLLQLFRRCPDQASPTLQGTQPSHISYSMSRRLHLHLHRIASAALSAYIRLGITLSVRSMRVVLYGYHYGELNRFARPAL